MDDAGGSPTRKSFGWREGAADNPLERFDMSNLWNEEDDPKHSALNELIATVQEELENLERKPDKGAEKSSEWGEEDAKRLREQRLDRWLQQKTFSYSSVIDSAKRLHEILDQIEDRPQSPEHDAYAKRESVRDGGKMAKDDKDDDDPMSKPLEKEEMMNARIDGMHEHHSFFTGQLLAVASWLERRRGMQEDALDSLREQVLVRADRAEAAAMSHTEGPTPTRSRRNSSVEKRQSLKPGDLASKILQAQHDWSIAEEVATRTEAHEVIEALDFLEMEMNATLSRFYHRLAGAARTPWEPRVPTPAKPILCACSQQA